jgi:hypothetical protein
VGTGWFLFGSAVRCTGSRIAGWIAFLLFALNPRLIYLFTTPMTEPLMIFCASGLAYFLICWIQTERRGSLALAAVMAFGGTLTRYDGWAVGAAAIGIVMICAPRARWRATLFFSAAVCAGPFLWMLFNGIYFKDPLIFLYGKGSARDYALDHLARTGKTFPTAGSWAASLTTYFIDVAYCLNPIVLWLAIAGLLILWLPRGPAKWRTSLALSVLAGAPFAFYVYNLYSNSIPILMPGFILEGATPSDSIFNVRYGSIMAATLPICAAIGVGYIFRQAAYRRAFSFLMLAPLIFPDPIPQQSEETVYRQFTDNLFYTEGIHNQSFWLPPFVQVGDRLTEEIARTNNGAGFVLTNARIMHAVVWRTKIPMRRFIIDEMYSERWDRNLREIEPGVRWVITEEGDQLWQVHGRFLQEHFTEVANAKLPSTETVHLYRRF